VIVSVIVLVVTGDSSDADSNTATGINWFKVVLGVLFLVLSAKQWKSRPRKGVEPTMPGWMATLDSVTPGKALALGALLSGVNPKNLVLTAAAALVIAQAQLPTGQTALAVLAFVVIGSMSIAAPVAYLRFGGPSARARLDQTKVWLAENNSTVMCVLLFVFGVVLIGKGIGGL
jgi:threonine/homoserine/homoserine lactone efflux protein